MKIQSIRVQKVRGLVDFSFEPKGNSVVVSGPNGSGKSALVDAIDFLFTGKISRLEGKETGELSLKEHGPHVDHKLTEAIVSAEVILDNGKKYKIERRMSDPNNMKCDPPADAEMKEILDISKRGYHVLTRREILRYIAAEPSTRAQEVQALLDVSEIEDLRKLINGVRGDFEKQEAMRTRDVAAFQADVTGVLTLGAFTEVAVLSAVNAQRSVLGGPSITLESISDPKQDVQVPSSASAPASDPVIVSEDIKKITFSEEVKKAVDTAEKELRCLSQQIQKDPDLRTDLDRKELIDLGLSLIGDGKKCPLCEKPWGSEELRKYLEDKQRKAGAAKILQDKAQNRANEILRLLASYQTVLPRLSIAAKKLGLKDSMSFFDSTSAAWTSWLFKLSNPLMEYPVLEAESISAHLLNNSELQQHLATLGDSAKKSSPVISPEQKAWDVLTKFEVQWSSLTRLTAQRKTSALRKDQCTELYKQFEKARDAVMGGLYSEIEAAFIKSRTSRSKSSIRNGVWNSGSGRSTS